MQSVKTFVSQSLKNFVKIGSILPSSKNLARRMVKGIGGPVIVELGPGTGVITKEILKKLPKDGKLFSIENNEMFVHYLAKHIKDDRLMVCVGDAMSLKKILKEQGIDKVSYIVSGLPLGNFTKANKRKFMEVIVDCLEEDGTYIQFEYLLAGIMAVKSFFSKINISYEILNVPPAFVMRCKKIKKRRAVV